jgi:hypothetical protein
MVDEQTKLALPYRLAGIVVKVIPIDPPVNSRPSPLAQCEPAQFARPHGRLGRVQGTL